MIHPDTELRFLDPAIGCGVFATRAIPRGTIIWVRCGLDQVFTPERAASLSPPLRAHLERYAYLDEAGDWVLCWDHARFVNHSCEPAMLPIGPGVEILVRDLSPGDELTCEYALCNVPEPLACSCGRQACRGEVSAKDVVTHAPLWDRHISEAMAAVRSVPQALADVVPDRAVFEAIVRGERPVPSVRALAFARTGT